MSLIKTLKAEIPEVSGRENLKTIMSAATVYQHILWKHKLRSRLGNSDASRVGRDLKLHYYRKPSRGFWNGSASHVYSGFFLF